MKSFSTLLTSLAVIMLLAIASACGTSTTTGSSTSSTSSSNSDYSSNYTTPTSSAAQPYTTGTTPTSTASTTGAEIKTTTATVNGQQVSLLTTAQGMTLYYYKPDTATTAACTGGCASSWPPYTTSKQTPTSATSLPGKLAVLNGANGAQITYNGHPLYTYAGDTSAGATNGEGLGGIWFVATTTLSQLS